MNRRLELDLHYTRAELAFLTRAVYFETMAQPHVSLLASVNGGTFRAVGQAWRPQHSTMRYQHEINRQTPHFSR